MASSFCIHTRVLLGFVSWRVLLFMRSCFPLCRRPRDKRSEQPCISSVFQRDDDAAAGWGSIFEYGAKLPLTHEQLQHPNIVQFVGFDRYFHVFVAAIPKSLE